MVAYILEKESLLSVCKDAEPRDKLLSMDSCREGWLSRWLTITSQAKCFGLIIKFLHFEKNGIQAVL
jgi:hypothetical protein